MGKEQFSSNVIVANEYTLLGTGSVYGELTVGAAFVEAKVGAAKLAGRTVVYLCAHPDNTGYIYIGLDNTVATNKYFYVLPGGAGIAIKLDTADAPGIFLYGSAAGQKVGVCEVKSS